MVLADDTLFGKDLAEQRRKKRKAAAENAHVDLDSAEESLARVFQRDDRIEVLLTATQCHRPLTTFGLYL